MTIYAVGDIQGCHQALASGLKQLNFNPIEDILYCVGDLVNRGPQSGDVVRYLMDFGSAIRPVLGNHDISLLVAAEGIKDSVDSTTRAQIIEAPDSHDLINWLRQQPLARYDEHLDSLFIHAGLYPGWSPVNVIEMSNHISRQLQDPRAEKYHKFLTKLFGDIPARWSADLGKRQKNRFIVNACTRMRYITPELGLDLQNKGAPQDNRNPALTPWFSIPNKDLHNRRVFFGHWATLGLLEQPPFYGLDTGCVWGKSLTFAQIEPDCVSIVLQVSAQA